MVVAAIVGPSEEPTLLPRSHSFLFLLVTAAFPGLPAPPALVAASDLAPPVVTMICSRADRCILRMILVSSAAAEPGRRQLLAVVVTVAKGYDLGYVWKNQGQVCAERTTGGYYINAAQAGEPPGRWWGLGQKLSASSPARLSSASRTTRFTSSVTRGPGTSWAGPAAVCQVRRPSGAAEGGRAACHRGAGDRAGARGGPGDPPARRLYRRDGLVLQVDLGAARLDQGKRPAGTPGG